MTEAHGLGGVRTSPYDGVADFTDSLYLQQKETLKVKKDQLMKRIVANPEDTRSLEARSLFGGPWGVGVKGGC